MNKMVVLALIFALSGCAYTVPTSLKNNPNIVISDDGVNGQPAFKSIVFIRPSSSSSYVEQCLLKEAGGSVSLIREVYSVTGQSAYVSNSLRRSIPFQYSLSLRPEEGVYRFEKIRFNEDEVGGPLFASEAVDAEKAYAEMEAIVGRIQSCL
ncbi:hypothetical protein [Chromohalobacter moromii]|uniref:Lipoprotein n=1 Tax=Chromohalobacter moromii TaxID=2860329 RepID=A0A9X2X3W0_9GAMM|nr:hypothetical protein [Chromohalobacter moromii]MCK2046690.1 hypothetical protein [Chromohalobacter moromii]MCT8506266.1 hypothetical protein [Chromohalobacter moromii]